MICDPKLFLSLPEGGVKFDSPLGAPLDAFREVERKIDVLWGVLRLLDHPFLARE